MTYLPFNIPLQSVSSKQPAHNRFCLACSGYVNPYSVYICWLCGTVFLHLPSLESMGFDVKADVSVLLTTFLMSMVVGPICLPSLA